jgi:hypothetical protein
MILARVRIIAQAPEEIDISQNAYYVDNNSTPTIVSNLLEAKHSLF